MRHAACHFSISPLTRGKTAGAVARAAYIGRYRLHDERTGQTFSYTRRGGLLEEGTVNWSGGIERLWNQVERSETRKNSRLAREIKVALPVELPLDEMRRVVHGYCCNLADRYGLAAQWVIHASKFHDSDDGRRVERLYRQGSMDWEEYLGILSDPARTNRNFHAHILISNRKKDRDTGVFNEKIRCLDHARTGPEEIQNMRDEWEIRANSALKRVGADVRIDLRSNEAMAAAGHAPDGLVVQPHVGPRASHGAAPNYPRRVKARKEIRKHNAGIWVAWEQRRALERERARLEASERVAAEREAARKAEAAAEKRKIAEARTEQEAQVAAREAVHISSPRGGYEDVIAMAQSGAKMEMPPGEDLEIDPETHHYEGSTTPFQKAIKVRRRVTVRERVRSR
ncbi:MobA/MobL family protein [Sediminimonas qiaohouensis]|uniref:MobA/MobL family protein n=1 Tax=Sediminimonas qiaohouensis TaxID=552061 RepID=UPI0003F65AD6|nr:MobA/MobL family protein [Sediminimonas qiaohouensis]